ncbi:MAG: PQQ-binding-like beta-propeller repeat protein [candidate division KSB1 bacterium]|nr:PQQ-binding-like beta-propeller repeat protein [candidate division KSB1 bacterium]
MKFKNVLLGFILVFCFSTRGYSYTFVQITDTHVNNERTRDNFRNVIAHIQALNEKPDFIINTGDLTEFGSAREFRLYRQIADSAEIRMIHLPGNHDTRWSNVGKKRYIEFLGPLYHSFDHKGIHFIILDSSLLFQQFGHISQDQLRWLENDLKRTGLEIPVVIALHHPIMLDETYIDNESALFQLIKDYNVILVMTGHGHRNEHWNINGIDFVMTQAVKSKKPVYRLFHVEQDVAISVYDIDINESKRRFAFRRNIPSRAKSSVMQILSPRKSRVHDANLPILIGLKRSGEAEFSFDKKHWQKLQANGMKYYENLDISSLSEGYHDLYIRVTRDDSTWMDVCEFNVDRGNFQMIFSQHTAGEIQASPVITDSTIIFGSTDSVLYNMSISDGAKIWTFSSGGPIATTPEIANDTLFFTSGDGYCYALDARSGQLLWKTQAGEAIFSSPIYYRKMILFGSSDSSLYALNSKDGSLNWKYKTGGFIKAPPAVSDGVVTFGSWDGKFYCLSVDSGELIWEQRISESIYYSAATSHPIIVKDKIFVSSHDHTVHAFDLHSGDILWQHQEQDNHRPGYSSPAIIRDKVIFGSLSGHLFALNEEDGKEIWTTTLSNPLFDSSPYINYPNVLVGSVGGEIYCVSLYSGEKQWTHNLNSGFIFSSPVVHDQVIYVGTTEGYFYALKVL